MDEYKWSLNEIDNLQLSHLLEIMDRRVEKAKEEERKKQLDGLDNVLGAMGL